MTKEKKIFIVRFISFLITSLIAPITYFIIRFNLFQVTSRLQIGAWGIIVFAIILAVVSVLIKYYIDAMKTKYTFMKQVLSGFIKLILPLVFVLVIFTWLKDNIDLAVEALWVIIPCEVVAICVNPLPKWCYDNNVEGLGEILDKLESRKKASSIKEQENKGE